jgi:hypothetical protein
MGFYRRGQKFSADRLVRVGRLFGRKRVIFHICAGWPMSRGPRVNQSPLVAAAPLYRWEGTGFADAR